MPPKPKFTKDEITAAAYELVRPVRVKGLPLHGRGDRRTARGGICRDTPCAALRQRQDPAQTRHAGERRHSARTPGPAQIIPAPQIIRAPGRKMTAAFLCSGHFYSYYVVPAGVAVCQFREGYAVKICVRDAVKLLPHRQRPALGGTRA